MTKKNPNLTAEQKLVMFEDGTEPPGTSELNNEKREGSYYCVNCRIKLFDSVSKLSGSMLSVVDSRKENKLDSFCLKNVWLKAFDD